MRRALSFRCDGATLAATLDDAGGRAGLLIVSGGNEVRIGAHRGMAALAARIAAAGYPVLRFDRRGIGDSEGANGGFESSGPDIAAAAAALRAACPAVTRIVGFGNCDAATALLLHQDMTAIDALVLGNPWVVEPVDDLPPPAAIKGYYRQRLRDPRAWVGLVTGRLSFAKLARGLARVIRPPAVPATLAQAVARALTRTDAHVLLAVRDGTALAFADAVPTDGLRVTRLDSASHSFASADDEAALDAALLAALRG